MHILPLQGHGSIFIFLKKTKKPLTKRLRTDVKKQHTLRLKHDK
jgi:hypothetical protein